MAETSSSPHLAKEGRVVVVKPHPQPVVSVIVPTLDGSRGGNVPKLIDQIVASGFPSLEILLAQNIRPNGRARDEGVKRAKGKYYVFMDDDVQIGSRNLIESLLAPFQSDASIGMTGASYLIPADAPRFQHELAKQLPRLECPVVKTLADSDMVCHACLAVPAEIYRRSGGESPVLQSGTDPDFKARIRKLGYRIVLVPDAWVTMPTHPNVREMCRKAFSAGRNSARMQQLYPELVFQTAEGLDQETDGRKAESRMIRSLKRMITALLRGHWLYLLDRVNYLAGYFAGSALSSSRGKSRQNHKS